MNKICIIEGCGKYSDNGGRGLCPMHYKRLRIYGDPLYTNRNKDLTGKTFGRLLVVKFDHKDSNGHTYWQCQCNCGKQILTRTDLLIHNLSHSCGCLAADNSKKRLTIHGYTSRSNPNGNPTYVSWKSMKQRCYNPKNEHYHDYGERGITVCEQWVSNFSQFVKDMGERPDGLTLDRIDVNGNYEPGNCRWVNYFVQNNNSRWNKKYKLLNA